MTASNYANYHISLKVLLKKGREYLFLKDARGEHYDLPGGRIDTNEHHIPLTAVLDREVREELGNDVKYVLGEPVFNYRRHF